MICERCLKELNAAFEFAERSRSAEKLYFAKLREEFETNQQEPEKAEAEATKVKAEYEEVKIKREPSIEIEDVGIECPKTMRARQAKQTSQISKNTIMRWTQTALEKKNCWKWSPFKPQLKAHQS
jgi:hypothetical protein